ncbi:MULTISPECIES: hypothetical protein [Arthrobacter]|uniref:Uncharacterized protein n=2 Tax=Arthrobacter TaxID=1663 RepID=A0ABU9KMK2_9MICC|nr:hypothetical protein [Arthrobacter sp. YJM1]MDP5227834.1 hypothetical protein [Arthrobacter sp. YJM1]
MEFILVLQWPATSEADYDVLISLEEHLESDLNEAHGFVDGHDFGAGEMNLFVHTDQPLDAFRDAQEVLGADPRWATVRAAYRSVDGDDYTVIWPVTLQKFSVS